MSNCKYKRIICPDGIWTASDLVGAHVKVMSMPATNFFQIQDADKVCTIKDINFRISLDGKAITTIELKEFPGKVFTWKDLCVIGLVQEEPENEEESGE